MLRFRKFPLAKKFMDKRRGGASIKIFRPKFFVSHCRKTSYKNPSVFDYFRVSKNFMLQRVTSRLSVKTFLSDSAEFFRWETF